MPLQNAQGRLRRFVCIQDSIEKGAQRFVKQPGIASTDPSARTRQVSRSQHLINKVESSRAYTPTHGQVSSGSPKRAARPLRGGASGEGLKCGNLTRISSRLGKMREIAWNLLSQMCLSSRVMLGTWSCSAYIEQHLQVGNGVAVALLGSRTLHVVVTCRTSSGVRAGTFEGYPYGCPREACGRCCLSNT